MQKIENQPLRRPIIGKKSIKKKPPQSVIASGGFQVSEAKPENRSEAIPCR
jgi:hypothetical protein